MLTRNSLYTAEQKGIRTPGLVEYDSYEQLPRDAEFEIGILKQGEIDKGKVCKNALEGKEHADKIYKFLGSSAEIYFREAVTGELAYIASVTTDGTRYFDKEVKVEDLGILENALDVLTEDYDFASEMHLIFHYVSGKEGELVLTKIVYGE